MTFAELNAHPALEKALAAHGYDTPTPVQAAVLDPVHAGRDLLVSSQTGSGKTVAFGLVLAGILLGEREELPPAGKPRALVIAPTRELAQQVARELGWLYESAGARVLTCVGGTEPRVEARALAGGAHIVVGTPGRLCDHLDRKQLDLTHVEAVVLDEADEMLDMGFRDELERILRDAPRERRTILFSATLPPGIGELARRYQQNAARIVATPPEQAHQDIEYRAHLIVVREREHAVVNTLRQLEEAQALVFCETRSAVTRLHGALVERGFAAAALSGELTQAERTRALKSLRDGHARVLVATDVAARGLDLPDVGLVIHADLPHDPQILQHRSGRTGRAGKKGVTVLLVPFSKRIPAERMLARARVQVAWTAVPSAADIRALDEERILRDLRDDAREPTEAELVVARRLLEERTPEEIAAALVRVRRAQRPAPEELTESASVLARGGAKRPGLEESGAREVRTRLPRTDGLEASADVVWFSVNVGRTKNADPRWLLPLICRRGGVTKRDIGKIVILAEETRVGISKAAAVSFALEAAKPDPKDPRVLIHPAEGGGGSKPPATRAPPVAPRPAPVLTVHLEPIAAAPPRSPFAAKDKPSAERAAPSKPWTPKAKPSAERAAPSKPWTPKAKPSSERAAPSKPWTPKAKPSSERAAPSKPWTPKAKPSSERAAPSKPWTPKGKPASKPVAWVPKARATGEERPQGPKRAAPEKTISPVWKPGTPPKRR